MTKNMRSGYTTGSCAAAGTKAVLLYLQKNIISNSVSLNALSGEKLSIPIKRLTPLAGGACAEVIKDAGDDPDITNGVSIFTELHLNDTGNISFFGGKGIGTITREGMSIPVGEPAINLGPRKMITNVIREFLPENQGCDITISIPAGVELAKRTLNPVLGIKGGISVIGTSGIVRPMSEEGFKNSLTPQIDVAYAAGLFNQVFVPGKIGENIAIKLGLPKQAIIQTSNFIGHMLDYAAQKKLKSVLLVGHLGKLVKVAAGNFHTHSKISDARLETLAAYSALLGMDQSGIKKIFSCVTTEAVMPIISDYKLDDKLYPLLCQRASFRSMQHVYNDLTVGTIMVTLKGTILGMDENAKKIGRELHWNTK
ncbi:cobalt-precorrin-5B (C(1))-methyltransferase CbiD [Pectinatus sottacetonis]|uniref:cobalt-precorrin-5B (C(1))-methyltransferase CbiD n=1 Tax=Pectinatus sottacetonis TaxID=1002795 RepID=UPI0018C745A2|nr:cobalt-precorrin-5B (C(1))-methyltransferase CbiD [Pectinatus sottacetonis]